MRKSSDYFVHLSAGARQDLLRVLTSPSHVRADVIRQFHERGEDGMVDVLSDLEADKLIRLQTIEALRRTLDRGTESVARPWRITRLSFGPARLPEGGMRVTIVSVAGYLERDLRKWRAVLDSVDKMQAVMGGMLNVARVLDDVNRPMREMQRNWKLAQTALAQQELVTTYLVRPWVERQPCEDWLAEPEVDAEARTDEPDDLGYWPGYL